MNNTATIGLCTICALLSAAVAYTTLDAGKAQAIKLYHIASEPKEQEASVFRPTTVAALTAFCGVAAAIGAFCIQMFSTNLAQSIRLLSAFICLTGAACNDGREKRIPNIFPLILTLVSLGAHIGALLYGIDGAATEFFGSAAAAVATGVCLALTSFLTKQGIGTGDIKLLCALALECGVFLYCRALFFGMVYVAFAAAVLLLTKKKKMSDNLPFAPFIYLGFVTALFLFRF